MTLRIGVNRWDGRSVGHFAASVAEGEANGVDVAFQPVNPLLAYDPYVLLSAAATATSSIGLGPLLETPALRPPAVAAGSIATLDQASAGRALLTYGVGDTAVRMLGQRPSRLTELEEAVTLARRFLRGDRIDLGAARPARLRFARPVPVWVAASGPRSLRMAGRVADGVFLRVGTHPANLDHAVAQVAAGAVEAGRDPAEVGLGLIVHTIRSQDPAEIATISRCMAAGFYEYAPALFDPPGFEWTITPIDELRRQVWPDFHHVTDFTEAGALIADLPQEIADSFSFFGTTGDIAQRLDDIARRIPGLDIVVLHPVPFPGPAEVSAHTHWIGHQLKPLLGGSSR